MIQLLPSLLGKHALWCGFRKRVTCDFRRFGETKTVRISENDFYGSHNPDLVMRLDLAEYAERGIKSEIGLALETNQARVLRGTDISDTTVTLDANHPLAGHTLTF